MSTWSRGAEVEKMYCYRLEKDGWITRRFPKVRFGKQDIWGCDIVAKRFGFTLWIQVKSEAAKMPAIRRKDLDKLEELNGHCEQYTETVQWVGYNRKTKEWKIVEL